MVPRGGPAPRSRAAADAGVGEGPRGGAMESGAPGGGAPGPIEVEAKFAVGPGTEAALAALGAVGLPPSPPFRDCYFDGPRAPLARADVWLRYRQGQGWQLKLPHGDPRPPHGDPRLPHGHPEPPHRDPRPPHGDPEPPHGDPRLLYSDPRLPHGNPEPPHGDPRPPHGDPEPPHGDPELPRSDPELPHGDPRPPHGDPEPPHSNPRSPHSDPQPPHGDPRLPHSDPEPPHGAHPDAEAPQPHPESAASAPPQPHGAPLLPHSPPQPHGRPTSPGGAMAYREVWGDAAVLAELLRVLGVPPGAGRAWGGVGAALRPLGLRPTASFVTRRRSAGLGGLRVELDRADFGYGLGEVELLLPHGAAGGAGAPQLEEARRRVEGVCRALGAEPQRRVPGKLSVFLARHRPRYFALLRAAGRLEPVGDGEGGGHPQ